MLVIFLTLKEMQLLTIDEDSTGLAVSIDLFTEPLTSMLMSILRRKVTNNLNAGLHLEGYMKPQNAI